jgi:hypothetical protein
LERNARGRQLVEKRLPWVFLADWQIVSDHGFVIVTNRQQQLPADRASVFFPAPHREAARSVAVSPHGTAKFF